MSDIQNTDSSDSGGAAKLPSPWRIALPALLLALLGIGVCGWQTAYSMVAIWHRSETFAHGFVVPAIVAWLVWRSRGRFLALSPRPCWWFLLPLAFAGLAWLLGEMGNVNSMSQFAFVAMLVLAVPLVAGLAVARAVAFPLVFLFFAVPVGEFLLPQLMESTADFTVSALRLTGVPVYREGQQLIVPSGHWSVVEACSGIRYLIASLMVGTLYAYLNYRSLGRRIGFVLISGLVPLVANWFRAYMIVMIGHLSDNRLATGVDHVIYGWVFFGIVMALMFWIGSFWHQDPAPIQWDENDGLSSAPVSPVSLFVAVFSVLLVAGAPMAVVSFTQPHQTGTSQAPIQLSGDLPGWQVSSGGLTDWQPSFSGASDVFHLTGRKGSQEVGFYLGYYRHQTRERKLVSSTNFLAAVDGTGWTRVAERPENVLIEGQPVRVKVTELRNRSGEERLLAWRWYWIHGHVTASDYWAKAYVAFYRLLGRGDDGAVVVIYARMPGPKGAESLHSFVAEAIPSVHSALNRTVGGR